MGFSLDKNETERLGSNDRIWERPRPRGWLFLLMVVKPIWVLIVSLIATIDPSPQCGFSEYYTYLPVNKSTGIPSHEILPTQFDGNQ